MLVVLEAGDDSLAAVVLALRGAGFEPAVRDAPNRWPASQPRRAAWVPMPGDNAYAVVVAAEVEPGEQPGTWREAPAWTTPQVVRGYEVSFHENPFRTRGHSYADAAARVRCVFLDDIVATVRDWADWESIWSTTPVLEPANKRNSRMRRVAASKVNSGTIPVDLDIDPLMHALLDTAQVTAAHAVLEELFLPGIRWRFPRDKNGTKLAARTQVLLHECAPPANPAGKGVWLVVDGPTPRSESRLTIRLSRAVGKATYHRWDRTPEYWRTGPCAIEELWGIGQDTTAAHVDEVTDALLAGRTLDALAMCGVSTDRSTRRLLSGLPDRFELREWTDKWVSNATNLMVNAAPWLWHDAVVPKQRPQRLETLGGFNPNRRPGLFLEHRDGRAHLSFDQSASPLVLPRVGWQRDPDYDLIRLGLLTRDQIPMPPP